MKKITLLVIVLTVSWMAGACAVKDYPRAVTTGEKMQTNIAYSVDTTGAVLYSSLRAGPGYDIERQKVHVDYDYYLDPKFRDDPRSFYPEIAIPPQVEFVSLLKETDDYEFHFIKWESQYQPQNPAFVPFYETYVENHTAYGIFCKNKRGSRAAIVIAHGWTGGDIRKTWKLERMPEYAALGYDSVLVQQPYHGPRAPADSVFSGEYFVSGEIARINEAMCQAVTDVRSMAAWLREKYEVVGVRGGSLGGITTLQTAAVEDRIDFAVAWVPPSSLGDIPEETPLAPFVIEGMRASGLDQPTVKKVVYVSSPKNFEPAIAKEHVLMIAGMGDNFVPPNQPAMIWEAWGEPEIVWFAGGHVVNFEKKRCQEREREFLISRLP